MAVTTDGPVGGRDASDADTGTTTGTEAEAAAAAAAATGTALATAARLRRERGAGRARFDDLWTWACAALSALVVLAGLVEAAPGIGQGLGWSGGPAARAVVVGTTLLLFAGELALCVRLGPVLLSPAEITWLLPLPGDRGRLLRPRLVRAVAVAGAAALGLGAPATALALAVQGVWRPEVLPVTLGAHLALACLAVGLGTVVEARPAPAGPVRLLGRCLAVLGAAALAVGGRVPAVTEVAAWSGPWGWAGAATATVSAHGSASALVPAAALLCLAASAAVALRAAFRSLSRMPTDALLARARTGRQVTQGATLLDLRALTLVLQSTGGGRRRPAVRLPMPRAPWAVPLWRDAMVLLRHPWRPVLAAAVLAAGFAQLRVVADRLAEPAGSGPGPLGAAALGLLLVVPPYLAAVALAEPAYQDTDRPRRALLLPQSPGGQAVAHLAVPVGLLWAAGAVAYATAALAGPATGPLTAYATALLLAGPALVGTALVGAYRGAPRYDLLALSLDWYAAVPFVLWRLAPALAAGFVAAPYLWHVAYVPAAGPDEDTLWLAVRSAVVLAWAVRRIARQARDLCG
ncbi:DUF6297 family protein [Streptomyces sp. WAC06614]|uniref:DUF6297 family protein n=1 Tax=Streptomyces sp. WAC06614 TaxID=2487416 RepID=UPI000F786FEE|nr:DUF6297 family protein [Streptomyces sp. WAC06614]RSS60870.1 hypothetical protein EF918_32405 [Streptomyces sp. WAC06614]